MESLLRDIPTALGEIEIGGQWLVGTGSCPIFICV